MTKLQKILLSQNSLAKALGISVFYRATKINHHVELLKDLPQKRVMVISPHPDDDIFGCAGVLAKLKSKKSHVTIVYFCDGAEDLAKKRRKEAIDAAEILNIDNLVFFGCRDGALKADNRIIMKLHDLIENEKPDIIFTPSFLDNHPDHRAANDILIAATNELSASLKANLTIWAYEIWTKIFPNRIVDITDVIELKKRAIKAHKSQFKDRNYDKAILGLNQYRAEINGISGYAEAFFATSPEIYAKLYRKS